MVPLNKCNIQLNKYFLPVLHIMCRYLEIPEGTENHPKKIMAPYVPPLSQSE